MAKKVEVVGNYFVMTDTVTGNEDINEHKALVKYHVHGNYIRLYLMFLKDENTVGEEQGYLYSELVDNEDNAFGSLDDARAWFRSNTGLTSGGGDGDGVSVHVYANLSSFPLSGTLGDIYIADDTEYMYRWDSDLSSYIRLGQFLDGPAIKTLYESESNTNAFTDADHNKLGLITATQSIDLDNVAVKGSGTINSVSAVSGTPGTDPNHTATATIPGLWYMLNDDSSGLNIDLISGKIVNTLPGAGVYNLEIAFKGHDFSYDTQTIEYTVT